MAIEIAITSPLMTRSKKNPAQGYPKKVEPIWSQSSSKSRRSMVAGGVESSWRGSLVANSSNIPTPKHETSLTSKHVVLPSKPKLSSDEETTARSRALRQLFDGGRTDSSLFNWECLVVV